MVRQHNVAERKAGWGLWVVVTVLAGAPAPVRASGTGVGGSGKAHTHSSLFMRLRSQIYIDFLAPARQMET
jgi:hypothetical protein